MSETPCTTTAPASAVAIIGMACRFPGASDPDAFWSNLQQRVESVTFFSDQELREAGVDPAALSDPRYVRANPVVADVEYFDATFFGLSPQEAEILDPQQRLFLECAWEAIEAAGYDPLRYPGAVGVYAGVGLNTYLLNNLLPQRGLAQAGNGFQLMLANDKDFLVTRVAYKLNLKGPAITVQTACSTSLVAVHLACQGLLCGECDAALAGGVSVRVPQRAGYWYQEGMIFSPDGHCRAFDAEAQGTVGGNGAGVVLLKRLADALAEGDPIYAVIRGSAVNNDGAVKAGYTAPGSAGQEAVIKEALAVAGVAPETIGYVETHGTGTALGDPVEIAALSRAFGVGRRQFCAIGSVKTNFGHLDTAAGVAGLIKTVLILYYGEISPSLHYHRPNPAIDFTTSPFYVNTEPRPWRRGPRRAGVSSFGIGGTNAHVVLEQAPPLASSGPARAWQLLLLSARSELALAATATNLARHLGRRPDLDLADVAYTLATGRTAFARRRVLLCRKLEEAVHGLKDSPIPAQVPESGEPSVAFLFPGQGSQYVDRGRGLYQAEPAFREALDACAVQLASHPGLDLRQLLYPERQDRTAAAARLAETWLAQPALFAISYALGRLWRSWGIEPQALLGHSLGEYVAACLAGVLTLEDALALVAARGRLMQAMPTGAMLAVPLPEAELGPWLDEKLALAAVNGPAQCVVSGPTAAVGAMRERLARQGVEGVLLPISHAFHSAMMDPVLAPFAEQVAGVHLQPPAIPYISNVTGTWITPVQATDPAYWVQHLRQTVRFADGVRTLLQEPRRLLLEVGPGRTLAALARTHPDLKPTQRVLASLPRGQAPHDEEKTVLDALGQLWLAGVAVDWSGFYGGQRRLRLRLPTYPFERQRYWVDPPTNDAPLIRQKRADPGDWFYLPYWKPSLPPAAVGERSGWLVFTDTCGLGERLVECLRGQRREVIEVVPGPGFARLDEQLYRLNPGRREDYDALLAGLGGRVQALNHLVHLWCVSPVAEPLLERVEQAQDRGFYSLMYLAQALERAGITQTLYLSVISSRMQELSGAAAFCPEKATVLGPVTVIPQEYPHLRCRSIDIAAETPEVGQVEQLLAELSSVADEPVVAYRNRQRWVQAFESVRIEAPASAPRLRENGVYLITGGLGGIGLALAGHLARTVKARLVLTGRNPPAETVARTLQALETQGGRVLVMPADVTDHEQMQAALARAETCFGPVNGVIHAAGVPGGGVLSWKTRDAAARVLAPKVQGTLVLDAVCADRPLDFMVLCSSLAAMLGGFGQADYSAANAFLEAFAQYRSARGRPTLAIAWDTWQQVGMAVNTQAPEELRALRAQNLAREGIAPAEGVAVFSRALAADLPRLLVSTHDWHRRYAERNRRMAESLAELAAARQAQIRHARPELETPYISPDSALEQHLAELWAENLGFRELGVNDDYFELGGDSLKGLSLVNRLQERLGEAVSINALFEAPTISRLTAYLRARHSQASARLTEPGKPASEGERIGHRTAPAPEAVAALSDAEVDAALTALLAGRQSAKGESGLQPD